MVQTNLSFTFLTKLYHKWSIFDVSIYFHVSKNSNTKVVSQCRCLNQNFLCCFIALKNKLFKSSSVKLQNDFTLVDYFSTFFSNESFLNNSLRCFTLLLRYF